MDVYQISKAGFGMKLIINYYEGKRNKHRLLWSNDGLIFVTYGHYEKFYKIIREENSYGIRKSFNFPEWYGKKLGCFLGFTLE